MPLTTDQQLLRDRLIAKMREQQEQHAAMMRYKVGSRDVSCLLASYYRVDEFQFGRLTLYIPKTRPIGNRVDHLIPIGTKPTAVYPLQRYEIDICTDIITQIAEVLYAEHYAVKRLGNLSNPVVYLEYSIIPQEWIARRGLA